MKRGLTLAAALLALVLAGLGTFEFLHSRRLARDVRGSSTQEFTATTVPARPRPSARQSLPWPMFGRDTTRTHAVDVGPVPPFRRVWGAGAWSLIEFPPSIGFHRLFFQTSHGSVVAVSTRTGARAWLFDARRCAAASPAVGRVDGGTVYAVFLQRMPCAPGRSVDGEVVALAAGTGAVRWRRRIGPSETSPLLVGGRVLVGDWDGRVWALDARTGKTTWTFDAAGAVKGGLAASGSRLYFGAYDGHVYALAASTGRLLWRASAQPRAIGSSTFYSTPAVAYGRVYIGSTDHKVYSYGAATGVLRWSHTTGGYVYGSPAIAKLLVLVGSYDGRFYAFDAATGQVAWTFEAGSPISGSANVLGNIVYFATLNGRTYALSVQTGRLRWVTEGGHYSAPVTDGHQLYVVGSGSLYAYRPR